MGGHGGLRPYVVCAIRADTGQSDGDEETGRTRVCKLNLPQAFGLREVFAKFALSAVASLPTPELLGRFARFTRSIRAALDHYLLVIRVVRWVGIRDAGRHRRDVVDPSQATTELHVDVHRLTPTGRDQIPAAVHLVRTRVVEAGAIARVKDVDHLLGIQRQHVRHHHVQCVGRAEVSDDQGVDPGVRGTAGIQAGVLAQRQVDLGEDGRAL